MTDEGAADGSTSVVLAALRYAVVEGDSRLYRSYGVVSGLLAVFVGTLFVLALPVWVTESGGGALNRVGFGLLWLVGLALIATLLLPVLFVARRRRTGRRERQFHFALAGYGYVLSLYLGLLASAPPDLRDPPRGVLGPVLEVLYGLPAPAGLAFPIAGTALLVAIEYGLDREQAA